MMIGTFADLPFIVVCQMAIFLILIGFCLVISASAQTDSTITGDIKDSNGAVLVASR